MSNQRSLSFGEAAVSVPVYGVRLVREAVVSYEPITSPDDIAKILIDRLSDHSREVFEIVMLDAKLRPIGIHTVSIGIINGAMVECREVFQAAILANAASIVVGHNHPSGDPTPSMTDLATTRTLIEAGKIIGINVLDHIVIGANRHYSMAKNRVVDFPSE